MAFWLKKAVGFLLMPLSVCLILMIVGLWLAGRRERRGTGRGLMIAGVLLLLLFSNNLVSTWLVRPLEAQYPPQPEVPAGAAVPAALARCRYIVVLGGGHGDVEDFPATAKLSAYSLARIAEGARLARLVPEARLIVTGPAFGNHPTHASVLAAAALSLGVGPDRIIRSETGRDTEEESQAVRQLIGDAPVALVTSAWHLPRAVALFRHAGVDVLPCPADFLGKVVPGLSVSDFACEPEALVRSTYAVREEIGRLWIWLRGKSG
ncbi:MAG TPA: ElyC/SanA/YdcF family protein [Opitutaceae bacterium]|nr:ElyC/SanA/YdcF family protein [Opitutaceae bacterium]